jgi:hypothetical protein
MLRPFTFVNVPESELAFRMSKLVPKAGTKPLINLIFSVDPDSKLAEPLALSWSY